MAGAPDAGILPILLADAIVGNDALALRYAHDSGQPRVIPTTMATLLAQLLTTNGDDLYRNASGVVVRRAIGTTGQHSRVVAGVPTWADPAWKHLEALSGSGVASVDCTVTLAVGKTYFILIRRLLPASDSSLRMRISTDGSTYLAGTSDYAWSGHGWATAAFGSNDQADNEIELGNAAEWEATSGHVSGLIRFGQQSSQFWACQAVLGGLGSGGSDAIAVTQGRTLATTTVVKVRLIMSTGNMTLDADLYEVGT